MVERQCQPNGIGNGQSQTQFTAAASGMYYIKVGHNLQTTGLTGEYHIRILPKHDSAAAAWDTAYEPNNVASNAYPLQVGAASALNSSIEARPALYYTQNADVDWYRFEATAGVTYVLELFNVSANLVQLGSSNLGTACSGVASYYGLYLVLYDATVGELTKQCTANGAAPFQVLLTYAATTSGTHYIKTGHNLATTELNGTYSIRITTQ